MAETVTVPGPIAHPEGGHTVGAEANAGETVQNILLSVENMRCGSCMAAIERTLRNTPGVRQARANLTAKRVDIKFVSPQATTERLITALAEAGFESALLVDAGDRTGKAQLDDLLWRLAVAGFGAANVMLLSVSVWAGLASDMDANLQSLFHWLSALIAMPVIAYSAQPFFRSAVTALRAFRLNMDVPISLGILLATGMSLFQAMRSSELVYFDAAVMLTFFLLIGRFLDERIRSTARNAAQNLMAFKNLDATVITVAGATQRINGAQVEAGMRVLVARGERIPVDGRVVAGASDIENSLITGETTPHPVDAEDHVHAGSINLTAPLEIIASGSSETSLVAEIGRLMAAAEQARGQYRRLADRAAEIYAPAVHLLGAATFTGWLIAGAGWEFALMCGVAVLIITCPCALALAVPAVQVAATSRLFANGIIIKAADGLERMADINAVVFDKTGTLTTGKMRLVNAKDVADTTIAKAAGLAAASRHPFAVAVVEEARGRGVAVQVPDSIKEIAGAGVCHTGMSGSMKLGSAGWIGVAEGQLDSPASLWFEDCDGELTPFTFADTLRPDAKPVITELLRQGYHIELLSGDHHGAVSEVAAQLGIENWRARVTPDNKLHHIDALAKKGYRILMVGDGLNDAPAIAAGRASLSPSSAADITQTAADGVFQGKYLTPVVRTLHVAKAARRLALQNFGIALGYNMICIPLAIAGFVTPLIAALAMSASSIAVTANAARLQVVKLDGGGS